MPLMVESPIIRTLRAALGNTIVPLFKPFSVSFSSAKVYPASVSVCAADQLSLRTFPFGAHSHDSLAL